MKVQKNTKNVIDFKKASFNKKVEMFELRKSHYLKIAFGYKLAFYFIALIAVSFLVGINWQSINRRSDFMQFTETLKTSTNYLVEFFDPRLRRPQKGDQWEYCYQARAVGTTPIFAFEPGYAEHLDFDLDGVACEHFFGNNSRRSRRHNRIHY